MKYNDEEKTCVLLYILSQNRKKGAGKILLQELSIKTTHFQMGKAISSKWITSQQPDNAYNTKKWEKRQLGLQKT